MTGIEKTDKHRELARTQSKWNAHALLLGRAYAGPAARGMGISPGVCTAPDPAAPLLGVFPTEMRT